MKPLADKPSLMSYEVEMALNDRPLLAVIRARADGGESLSMNDEPEVILEGP